MAISFINKQEGAIGPGSGITVTKPTSTIVGDFMIATTFMGGTLTTMTSSGWTEIVDSPRDDPGAGFRGRMFYKVAGPAEPANYTFNFGASTYVSASICTYRGVDCINPFDTHSYNIDSVSESSHPFTGVTVTNSNRWAVGGCIKGGFDSTYTPPSGWAYRTSGSTWGNWCSALADSSGTIPTGSYTPPNWSSVANGTAVDFLLVLKPATIYHVNTQGSSQSRPGTSLTINKPTGATTDDFLLTLIWTYHNQSGVIADPTGWTFVSTSGEAGADTWQRVYYRFVDGTESGSFTWTFGATPVFIIGTMACYRGVNKTTPYDFETVYVDPSNTGTHPFSSGTVESTGRLGVGLMTMQGYQGSIVVPTGYADRYDTFGSDPLCICDSNGDLTAGAYAPGNWTGPTAGTAVSTFMALRPTGSATTSKVPILYMHYAKMAI